MAEKGAQKESKKGTDLFFPQRFILSSLEGMSIAVKHCMPRMPRVIVPNHPHHILQRGHNRGVVFIEREDYLRYLDHLEECKKRLQVKVYAYCLMTNHVHLILDPGERIDSIGLLMKHVAGRTTRYVNKLEHRSGTLWEGRFKSSPIQSEAYFLACCRYVELNPVRAGIVDSPEEYRWSSYSHQIGLETEPWMDQHMGFDDLGVSDQVRRQKYKEWIEDYIPQHQLDFIRKTVQRGQLTGSTRFQEEIHRKIGRRVECRGRGRPKKKTNNKK